MKYITKLMLAAVHQMCDVYDKSTEFTLQYMQDTCGVDMDCVLAYFALSEEEKKQLRVDVNRFAHVFAQIEESGDIYFH